MTTNAEYHADPAISASHLDAVEISPYHYQCTFLDPNRPAVEPTAAMRFGTLVHCAVLEPDELNARFAVAPDRRTKEGKAAAAEFKAAGIEPVSAADMAIAVAMRDAVRSHPDAMALLKEGQAEQSYWYDDKPSGLRCKCRPDWMTGDTLVDLKTTTDASPRGFAKSVAQYRYHVQADHYLAGTLARRMVFIAVEKTYPFAVGVYELDQDALDHAIVLRHQNLQTIADCQAIREWPGYPSQTISLPKWALADPDTVTSNDF